MDNLPEINLPGIAQMEVDENQTYVHNDDDEASDPFTLKDVCGPHYKSVRGWLKHFGILVKSTQKSAVYTNNPNGILHAERLLSGHTDCYEHVSSDNPIWMGKTVLVADCTIPRYTDMPKIVTETALFLDILFDVGCKVYLWTKDGAKEIDDEDLASGHYRRMTENIMPISPLGFSSFLQNQNLTPDNAMLLDHENFQSISHIVSLADKYLLDFEQAFINDPFEPCRPTKFPSFSEPLNGLLGFNRLASLNEEAFAIFLALHNDELKPLHLLIDETTEDFHQDALTRISQFAKVILYLDNIAEDNWPALLDFISQLPKKSIIGFRQLYSNTSQCLVSDELVAEIVTSFHQLEYLEIGFCQEILGESLAKLNLSEHHALKALYFFQVAKTPHREKFDAWFYNMQVHCEAFLETLPEQLEILQLPRWPFSQQSFQKHLQNRLTRLQHLHLESKSEPVTTKWTHQNQLYSNVPYKSLPGWSASELPITLAMAGGYVAPSLSDIFRFQHIRPASPNPFALKRIRGSVGGTCDSNAEKVYTISRMFFGTTDDLSWEEQTSNPFEYHLIRLCFKHFRVYKQYFSQACLRLQKHFQPYLDQERPEPYTVRFDFYEFGAATFTQSAGTSLSELIVSTFYDAERIIIRRRCSKWGIIRQQSISPEQIIEYQQNLDKLQKTLRAFFTNERKQNFELSQRISEHNDVYVTDNNLVLYYREIFSRKGKKISKPHYHIIHTKSHHTWVDAITNYRVLLSPGDMDEYEALNQKESSVVCARFTHTCGSGELLEDGLERVALPSPGLYCSLDTLYCSGIVRNVWYCRLRHQYFADVEYNGVEKNISFQYGLKKTEQTQAKLVSNPNAFYPETLKLPKLLHFEGGAVTQASLDVFIQACNTHRLYLEQIIDVLILYFRNFKDESLEIHDQNNDINNLDNLIMQQQRGVCRHRANLAFKVFNALFDYANAQANESNEAYYATITNSDIHSFLILNRVYSIPQIAPEPEFLFDSFDVFEQPLIQQEPQTFLQSELLCLGGSDRATLQKIEDLSEVTKNLSSALSQCLPDSGPFPPPLEVANRFLKPYPSLGFARTGDYLDWLDSACQNPNKSVLLVVQNWQHWFELEKLSRRHSEANQRNFVCISSFEDLGLFKLPASDFLDVNALMQGDSLNTRPLSKLGKILCDEATTPSLLMVRIRRHEPSMLNPLFDHRRLLREKRVPDHVKRIAIIDQALFNTAGDDLKSRFAKIIKADFSFLNQQDKPFYEPTKEKHSASFVFGEWQTSWAAFAGTFRFSAQGATYVPGWLEMNIRQGIDEIVLINPPKGMVALDKMLEQLQAGLLVTPFLEIETDVRVIHNKEAVVEEQLSHLQIGRDFPKYLDFVLNKQSFYALTNKQTCITEDGQIDNLPPYILQQSEKIWHILVSEALSNAHWQLLESLAKEHRIDVFLYFLDNAFIPSGFERSETTDTQTIRPLSQWSRAQNIVWQDEDAPPSQGTESDTIPEVYIDPLDTLSDIVGSVQKHPDLGLHFHCSALIQALRKGQRVRFFGKPNAELHQFFLSLLCDRPYLMVNGTPLFIHQTISLMFSSRQPAMTADTIALNSATLAQAIAAHALFGIRHSADIDPIAQMHDTLAQCSLALYREPHEISTWLSQGGLFIVNHLHEAPGDLVKLVRKFYAQPRGNWLWKGQFYLIAPDTHRVLFTEVFSEKENITLAGIPYFTFETIMRHAEPLQSSVFQANTEQFYATYLEKYVSPSEARQCVAHLHDISVLNTDKQTRDKLWKLCRNIIITETEQSDFADRLSPGQTPMAVMLILHLRLQGMLRTRPQAAHFARGLILEGSPGIGKTKVMFDLLDALGFENKLRESGGLDPNKPGYVSAPSDDIFQCRKAISLAIRHGYILIIDEINTLSLEAAYPDQWSIMQQIRFFLSANIPHSGILIASQNPSELFYGRNVLPFMHYCQKMIVPKLSKQDFIFFIGQFAHRTKHFADEMKQAFKIAKPNMHYPPNLRFFLRALEKNNPAKRRQDDIAQASKESSSSKRAKYGE